MKLQYKFLIIVIITTIFVVATIAYFSFTLIKSSIGQSIGEQQQQFARQTLDKVDRILHERYNDIQTIAGDETIEEFLSTETKENFAPEFVRRIQELAVVTGPWDDIDVIDKQGTIRYSLDPEAIGKDIREEPQGLETFNKTISGNTVYSDAIFDEEEKKPTMYFAIPIRDESNPTKPIVGAVIAHLSWPIVAEVVQSIEGSVVNLYNSEGIKIANNNNPETVFKENNSDNPRVRAALGGRETSEVAMDVDQKETISSSAIEKGFATYKGNKWVLLIEQPTEVAFAPAIESAVRISILLVPIIILANAIIMFFILRFLKPIEFLTKTSQEVAAGDLSKRIKVTSTDEIGQLGTAFNNMTQSLQELYAGLEQKVKDKTAELSQKVEETERLNKLMVGRELKMIELKKEIEQLKQSSSIQTNQDEKQN